MTLKLTILSLFCTLLASAQYVTGKVVDDQTNEPLEYVAVYFDNTTIGTVTDDKGYFEIDAGKGSNAPLVISFLGYEKIIFSQYSSEPLHVRLKPSLSALDEVIISSDDGMPRAEKLKYFRAQFLGTSKIARSCSILNEDDIILRYSKRDRMLTASAKGPIIVTNKALQYKITFDLEDFELRLGYARENNGLFKPRSMIYLGTSFYQPLEEAGDTKVNKKRDKLFKGSILHFMRALTKGTLRDEKYKVFRNGFRVEPADFITVTPMEESGLFRVQMMGPLSVLYRGSKQSEIKVPQDFGSQTNSFNIQFYVDKFGNYSPINAFYLVGHMGNLRVGDSLPLDYDLGSTK